MLKTGLSRLGFGGRRLLQEPHPFDLQQMRSISISAAERDSADVGVAFTATVVLADGRRVQGRGSYNGCDDLLVVAWAPAQSQPQPQPQEELLAA